MQKRTNKTGIATLKRRPTNSYTSVCCNALAEKPACVSFGNVTTREGLMIKTVARDKAADTQGLGSWRCSSCRKPCSVIRAKFDPAGLDKPAAQV